MKHCEKPLINIAQLLRVIGLLLIFEALFLVFPTLVCLFYNETDWMPFSLTTLLTGCTGIILLTRVKARSNHIGKRDGFLLTAMVWVVFSLFGMLPFITCSTPMSVSDSFFEAMSGFTTTGASTIVGHTSHGIMIWRALMQWIGGMGIILFTLAVVPMLNHSGGMQMFNAEVTGITNDKIRPRISQTAKSLWIVYLMLTIVLVALLWAGPMNLFDSVCHAFGAISTGGFSTGFLDTLDHGLYYVKIVLTIFMFLGGVNFGLIFKTVNGNLTPLRQSDVFRTYVLTILVFYILFALTNLMTAQSFSLQNLTVDSLFQVVSTITSTGYSFSCAACVGPFIMSLMLVMMFSGACAGSTSGGAKIDRILFLVKNCANELYRCVHPNSIRSVRINNKAISPELVNKVIAFLCIYVLVVVAGGVAMSLLGVPLIDSFFSAFSCMSNTGFGADITGFGGTYEILPDAAKWILALLMLIGRLEIFTVLVLFTPVFWRK